jgi:hypothetical protein
MHSAIEPAKFLEIRDPAKVERVKRLPRRDLLIWVALPCARVNAVDLAA